MKIITNLLQNIQLFIFLLLATAVLNFTVNGQTGVNPTCVLGSTFTQNFDTLANTGFSSTVPAGFGFLETLANQDTTYAAGTGSSNAGNTYSFGAAASVERAFGGLHSGTLDTTIGGCITNNTGGTLNEVTITYDGEQWRLGATPRATADRLDFEYSLNATSLNTGTWTAVNALDFNAPITMGTVGALDGNAAANRTAGITSTITGLTIPNGASFYFRFLDFDVLSVDDGLGIDNFTIEVFPATAANANVSGRVVDGKGNGIARASVMISGGELTDPLYATTNSFGAYSFDVPAGQTYFVTVSSRKYWFENPTQVINVNDNVTDADFVAEER